MGKHGLPRSKLLSRKRSVAGKMHNTASYPTLSKKHATYRSGWSLHVSQDVELGTTHLQHVRAFLMRYTLMQNDSCELKASNVRSCFCNITLHEAHGIIRRHVKISAYECCLALDTIMYNTWLSLCSQICCLRLGISHYHCLANTVSLFLLTYSLLNMWLGPAGMMKKGSQHLPVQGSGMMA